MRSASFARCRSTGCIAQPVFTLGRLGDLKAAEEVIGQGENQLFEAIGRWNSQVINDSSCVDYSEFASNSLLDVYC